MVTQKILRLQPTEVVDHITDDGTELTRQPYPFDAVLGDGRILNQRFWHGNPRALVGFTDNPAAEAITLWRDDIDPDDIDALVGKYMVTVDKHSDWSTYETAIASVKLVELTDEQITQMEDR